MLVGETRKPVIVKRVLTRRLASRAGHELDLFEAQMVAALRDERRDYRLLACLRAREHRRLLTAVIVAPLPQADERDM